MVLVSALSFCVWGQALGYDLHITRADYWAENESRQISPQEWLKVIGDDPSLTLDPDNGPYFAIYSAASGDESRWLAWRDGNVHSKNPDRETLEKMLAVARALGGRVQGDDGEHYEHVDGHSDDLPQRNVGDPPGPQGPNELPAYLQQERRSNRAMYALIALAIAGLFLVRQFL